MMTNHPQPGALPNKVFRRLSAIFTFLFSICVQSLVAGSLAPQGGIILIGNEELTYNDPGIGVFSPVGRHFFVGWRHEISAGDGYNYYSNVKGRFIEPNGKMSPEKVYSFSLAVDPYAYYLIGGYNSILDNFLLLWQEGYEGNSGTYSRIVHSNGSFGVRHRLLRATSPLLYSVAFSTFTNQFGYATYSSESVTICSDSRSRWT